MSDRLVLNLDAEEGGDTQTAVEKAVSALREAGITANGAVQPNFDPDTGKHDESVVIVNSRVAKP